MSTWSSGSSAANFTSQLGTMVILLTMGVASIRLLFQIVKTDKCISVTCHGWIQIRKVEIKHSVLPALHFTVSSFSYWAKTWQTTGTVSAWTLCRWWRTHRVTIHLHRPSSPPRPPGHIGVTMSRTNTSRSADNTPSALRHSAPPRASQNALRSDIWAD